MTQLTIQHWHNLYRSARPLNRPQLDEWDAGMADLDLDGTLDARIAEDEWVFIRRLKIQTRLRDDAGSLYARDLWQQALSQGLREALEHPEPGNLVRYRDRRDAIADMLYRAAQGDDSRRWAWVQGGLLPAQTTGQTAVVRQVVHLLSEDGSAIWPLLTRLILSEPRTGAWTAMVRTQPAALRELIALCPQTRPYVHAEPATPSPSVEHGLPRTELVHTLLHWSATQSALAQENHSLIVVLLAASAYPSAASVAPQQTAPRLVLAERALTETLSLAEPNRLKALRRSLEDAPSLEDRRGTRPNEAPRSAEPRQAREQAPAEEYDALRDTPTASDPTPPPELPDIGASYRSDWGGLLYLLNLIPMSGLLDRSMPDRNDADNGSPASDSQNAACSCPSAPDRPETQAEETPVARLLYWIAVERWSIPPSDPAVQAFCGGSENLPEDITDRQTLLSADEQRRCRAAADAIEHELRRRLRDDPSCSPAWLCLREALIRFEPGWIEARFPLNQADSRVRRAALDLDPGWLPWLGCVVRFVYE